MTKQFKQFIRLAHINIVLMRHGLNELAFTTRWLHPLRFLIYFNPWYWTRDKTASRGEHIRQSLEELGPIFVKFGQVLSTRRDLLPKDIANELAHLQSRVPPFPSEQARAIIEKEYGCTISEVFKHFDDVPLASASVAQVHTAVLHKGDEVVVKVLRPGIDEIIFRDIALLYQFARLAERYSKVARRLRPREIVAEFEQKLIAELDLVFEAASTSQLRRNFENSPLLYVPKIYWPYAKKRAMVMERIDGIPVNDIEALNVAGIHLERLAKNGVEVFFTQVFRDNFFHADMHPGNIFVSKKNPENPQYIALDCGIMGSLSNEDKRYLAENLLAFFKRDYHRVAELHVESGWLPGNTRVEAFESAIRTVCEPIFSQPLKDISFGQTLLKLFQTSRRFNMEVQPQLVLLQKTLLNIEGLGRELYPDLNLWTTAQPFLERWTREQLGPRALLRKIREQAPYWADQLPELPGLLHDALTKITAAPQHATMQSANKVAAAQKRMSFSTKRRRHFCGFVSIALLIAAGVTYSMQQMVSWQDVPALSWVLLGLSLAAGGSAFLIDYQRDAKK